MKIDIYSLSNYIPTVKKPERPLSFKEKMFWLFLIVALYFLLSHVPLIGTHTTQTIQFFNQLIFSALLGAKLNTLATLGISPIIVAGIILHILVTSKIININIREPEGRKKYNSLEKLFIVIFIFFESLFFVHGKILPIKENLFLKIFVFIQIVIGTFLIYFLVEIANKYTFISGINLIIFLGVSQTVIVNTLSPFSYDSIHNSFVLLNENSYPISKAFTFVFSLKDKNIKTFISEFLSLFLTIATMLLLIILLRTRIEIPITFQVPIFSRPLELSLLYTSILPLIFTYALIANFQFLAFSLAKTQVAYDTFCGILGCISSTQGPVSGFIYYITSPKSIFNIDLIRLLIHSFIIISLSVLFSYTWVNIGGMTAKDIADSLYESGFTISGFRTKQDIEKILNKYIPTLSILSGIIVGLIAIISEIFGIIGGIGLILATSISYSTYENLKREREQALPKLFNLE